MPFQVASRLPISKSITPLEEPIAYVVTGKPDSKCGLPMPCCAAQLSSEVHIVTGAEDAGFGATAGDRLNFATCPGGRRMNGFCTALVSAQFNGSLADCLGIVEQPAKKIAVQKMITAGLNTRPLCG